MKWNFETVNDFLTQYGGGSELTMSKEEFESIYKNNRTKLNYSCRLCGNSFTKEWAVVIKEKKFMCQKCGYGIGFKKNRSLEFKDVVEIFNKQGYVLLDKHFTNVTTKINGMTNDEFRYKFQTNVLRLKQGKKPNFFDTRNPYTIYNINRFIEVNKIPYTLIDDVYKGKNEKMKFVCNEHGEFPLSWTLLQRGHVCKECSYDQMRKTNNDFLKEVYELVENEYTFLEEYKSTHEKIKVKHNECGYEYKVQPSSFLSGRRCPECALEIIKGKNHYLYNPDLTEEDRLKTRRILGKENHERWRKQVFQKDSYTCQCCGKHGGVLNAHHLDGYHWCKDKRFDVNNGITLCYSCHDEFHNLYGRKFNTKEQFEEFMSEHKEVINIG